jgi:hypothetical protein
MYVVYLMDNQLTENYQNNILLSKITDIVNKKEQHPQLVAKLEDILQEYGDYQNKKLRLNDISLPLVKLCLRYIINFVFKIYK